MCAVPTMAIECVPFFKFCTRLEHVEEPSAAERWATKAKGMEQESDLKSAERAIDGMRDSRAMFSRVVFSPSLESHKGRALAERNVCELPSA